MQTTPSPITQPTPPESFTAFCLRVARSLTTEGQRGEDRHKLAAYLRAAKVITQAPYTGNGWWPAIDALSYAATKATLSYRTHLLKAIAMCESMYRFAGWAPRP